MTITEVCGLAAAACALGCLACDSAAESCDFGIAINGMPFHRVLDLGGDAPRPDRWRLCLNGDCAPLVGEGEFVSLPEDSEMGSWGIAFHMYVRQTPDALFHLDGYIEFGADRYRPGDDAEAVLQGTLTSGRTLRVPGRTAHFERVGGCHSETALTWL